MPHIPQHSGDSAVLAEETARLTAERIPTDADGRLFGSQGRWIDEAQEPGGGYWWRGVQDRVALPSFVQPMGSIASPAMRLYFVGV